MLNRVCLFLYALVFTGHLLGGTIQYEVSELQSLRGPQTYRYSYTANGIVLQENQELDIQFDSELFGRLYGFVADPRLLVRLFQPNDPPDFPGDFSAFAKDGPVPITEVFSVDFSFIGGGAPGPQRYFINEYDENGRFISTLATGLTTAAAHTDVPEPASFSLGGIGLLLGAGLWAVRHRSRGKA